MLVKALRGRILVESELDMSRKQDGQELGSRGKGCGGGGNEFTKHFKPPPTILVVWPVRIHPTGSLLPGLRLVWQSHPLLFISGTSSLRYRLTPPSLSLLISPLCATPQSSCPPLPLPRSSSSSKTRAPPSSFSSAPNGKSSLTAAARRKLTRSPSSNLLYPFEDKETNTLYFKCRTCASLEPATTACVYRNDLSEGVTETAGITQDVGMDPTVGERFSSETGIPGFCLLCGNGISCVSCGEGFSKHSGFVDADDGGESDGLAADGSPRKMTPTSRRVRLTASKTPSKSHSKSPSKDSSRAPAMNICLASPRSTKS
jgi:DNA-directed RNA polymerase II subunit RPB9